MFVVEELYLMLLSEDYSEVLIMMSDDIVVMFPVSLCQLVLLNRKEDFHVQVLVTMPITFC